jgi:hypothetical protein
MRRALQFILRFARLLKHGRHWQTLIDNYPQDPRVPERCWGSGVLIFSKGLTRTVM